TLAQELKKLHAERFLATTFTPRELAYCAGRPECLAARLAAKAAIVKAIGADSDALSLREIEIARHSTGEPYVRALKGLPWPRNPQNWQWWVSLAHESGLAIAVAIARPDAIATSDELSYQWSAIVRE